MALRLQVLMAVPLPLGLRQLKLWKEERVKREREEMKERLNSAMGQSVRKDMDVLLVPVRLHHQLLTAPLHLVKLLLDAVQRQAMERTAQRSCDSFYRRSFSLPLSCFPFFCVWFLCCQLASFWCLLCWACFALFLSVRVC